MAAHLSTGGGVARAAMLAAAVVVAVAASAAAAAAAPAADALATAAHAARGGYVYPSRCPSPPPPVFSERGPIADGPALSALIVGNYTVPGGEVIPGIPPNLSLACGDTLPGTDHTIVCGPGWPLGGLVLVPPARGGGGGGGRRGRPTASVVFIHGLIGRPQLYLLALSGLIQSDPTWWSTVRLVVPIAPVYKTFLVPLVSETFHPDPGYAWYDPSGTDAVRRAAGGANVPTAEALRRAGASGVTEDVAGMTAAAVRINAIVCGEVAVVGGSRGGGGDCRRSCAPPPPIVLLGHARGGTAALAVGLLGGAPLAGIVSLWGSAPLLPYAARHGPSALSAAPTCFRAVVAAASTGGDPAALADARLSAAMWTQLYGPRGVHAVDFGVNSEAATVLALPALQKKVMDAIKGVLGV